MCKVPEKMLKYMKCYICEEITPYKEIKGRIAICGLDIGNSFDISPRTIDAIKTADILICENSYWFNFKLKQIKISTNATLVELETLNVEWLVDEIMSGKNAALISNDGMPFIMDPGYGIVNILENRGIDIMIIPGPDTPVTALHASGLSTWNFAFEGNIPLDSDYKKQTFNKLINENKTTIFFEYDTRLYQSLKDLSEIVGMERLVSICFNLTKRDEKTIKGSLKTVLNTLKDNRYDSIEGKGEEELAVTIVVSGTNSRPPHNF